MANYLSIMQFLKEDMEDFGSCDLNELNATIDLMTYTMDFFRNLYSSEGGRSKISSTLQKIFALKKVELACNGEFFDGIAPELDNVICGVLYICLKVCKPCDKVTLQNERGVIYIKLQNKSLSSQIIDAIQNAATSENIFNTFALYVMNLAKRCDITIRSDFSSNNIMIDLWKEKSL